MDGLTWGRDHILPDTYGECLDPCITKNVTCDDPAGKRKAEEACQILVDEAGILKVTKLTKCIILPIEAY